MRLTKQAEQRLREEMAWLDDVEIPRVRTMVEDARSAGDNSQNPDYFMAAEEEGNVLARAKRTREALAGHDLADGTAIDVSCVQPGVFVHLDFGDGEEVFYVGAIEGAGGDVPVLTPLSKVGQALMGCCVGAEVDGITVINITAAH
jgi:transcription elongation factor GreA